MKKILISVFVLNFNITFIEAQIRLTNPSFEDTPSDATTPKGWMACNETTTPDILPGFWGVFNAPSEGQSYMGLITREDGTYESVGQRLPTNLEKSTCFQFSIDLAFSEIYSGYNQPIKLRIWLGDAKCYKDQLIFESPLLKKSEWKKYTIKFTPKSKYRYIVLEAFYQEGKFSHKGNILIDNISLIKFCNRV